MFELISSLFVGILLFIMLLKPVIIAGRFMTSAMQEKEIDSEIKRQKKKQKQLQKLAEQEIITNDQLRDILERVQRS